MRCVFLILLLAASLQAAPGDPDPVQRLQQRINSGEVELRFDHDGKGWLLSLLEAFDIPVSSQTLVFSKTSAQFRLIRPESPRAIYFNDDVYVGWVRGGPILEISAATPGGAGVFYSLDQEPARRPRFTPDNGTCLQCHESARTLDVPGHVTRSVHPAPDGQPVLRLGSVDVAAGTPLEQRFGGWYVSGEGFGPHLGNRWLESFNADKPLEPSAEAVEFGEHFDISAYLAPTSDIVANLLLAHQTEMHNHIARAGVEANRAIAYRADMTKLFGELSDETAASVKRRIEGPAEKLVRALLFVGEAPLPASIMGESAFRREFEERGPFDAEGRSLRQLDLERRLLRHPLSYLIYSESFDALPDETMIYVKRRLREALIDGDPAFGHLSAGDRRAIVAILQQTKPGLLAKP